MKEKTDDKKLEKLKERERKLELKLYDVQMKIKAIEKGF